MNKTNSNYARVYAMITVILRNKHFLPDFPNSSHTVKNKTRHKNI